MIVVDASAVLAILLDEPEAGAFSDILAEASEAFITPVNFWEVMVRARSLGGEPGAQTAQTLMTALGLQIASTSGAQAQLAVEAATRFGRGTPAALNLGDCFAYALAKSESCGLLFKGADFARTDVEQVAPGHT